MSAPLTLQLKLPLAAFSAGLSSMLLHVSRSPVFISRTHVLGGAWGRVLQILRWAELALHSGHVDVNNGRDGRVYV